MRMSGGRCFCVCLLRRRSERLIGCVGSLFTGWFSRVLIGTFFEVLIGWFCLVVLGEEILKLRKIYASEVCKFYILYCFCFVASISSFIVVVYFLYWKILRCSNTLEC